jgi:hypothetical protein
VEGEKLNSADPQMTEREQKFQRYLELQKDFYASEGVKLYNASLAQRSSCYTFQTNFTELYQHIKSHFELQSEHKLGDFRNEEPLHAFLYELTRRLHNFLASAKTLMDNTRAFVIHAYGKDSELFKEYVDAIRRSVDKSPVCRFTADLRNFFTHVGAPFVDSVMGGSEAQGRDRYTLRLNVAKMRQSRPWSSAAREYIEASSNEIDLELYVVDYYEKIIVFQDFLQVRVQYWSDEPWKRSLAIHDQVIAYWDPKPDSPQMK